MHAYAANMPQIPPVLYLPPGVSLPSQAIAAPGTVVSSGVPFDRTFFEQVLPPAVDSFCKQVACTTPLVELRTVDGSTHYVRGISGVSDAWVALHTIQPDHDHPTQVFIPYATIFRVEVHPAENERRHRLGFVLENGQQVKTVTLPAAAAAEPKGEPADEPEAAPTPTKPSPAPGKAGTGKS